MKKLALMVALMGVAFSSFAQNGPDTNKVYKKGRPTIGLVLAGGGAKGSAHIGVIKVLEEEGIPIDYIAGTSMGSIIGGLYALGYTSAEMDSIISNMDWELFMSEKVDRREITYDQKSLSSQYLIDIPFDIPNKIDKAMKKGLGQEESQVATTATGKKSFMNTLPGGYITGSNIFNMMNSLAVGYQDSIDFNDLPIPYACVSANILTGEQKIHRDGQLPMAMRASMAIPGFFTPVRIGDEVLVDGGMLNNFPVDVCKAMGADIIIGVNLSGGLKDDKEALAALPGLLGQLFSIVTRNKVEEHAKMCDIYLNPDMKSGGYGMLDFDKKTIQSIMNVGYKTADAKRDEIKALRKMLESYGVDLTQQYNNTKALNLVQESINISDVIWSNVPESDHKWLEKKTKMKGRTSVSKEDLDKAVSILYGTRAYSRVLYNVRKSKTDTTKYEVEFDLRAREPNSFRLGFRFDSYETAALGFRFGWNEYALKGFKANFSTKLSYNPWIKVSAAYAAGNWPNVNIEYMFKENDIDIYDRGAPYSHIRTSRQDVKLYLSQFHSKYLGSSLGLDYQLFRTRRVFSESDAEVVAFAPANVLGVFGRFDFDTKDRESYPTSGVDLNLNGAWNFLIHGHDQAALNLSNKMKLGQFYGSFVSYIPVTSRFNISPQMYAGIVFGKDAYSKDLYPVLDYFANYMGGSNIPGRHFQQELPFVGVNHVEYLYNNVVILRLDLRYRFGKNVYWTVMGNYLRDSEYIRNFFTDNRTDDIWGFGTQIGLDTAIGPVSLDIHWASHTKKVGAYLNIGHYF